MSRRIFLGLPVLFLVTALAVLHAQEPAATETTLRVLGPEDQKFTVQIDGKPSTTKKNKSKVRVVVAPPLAKEQKTYDVTVTWRTNNYTKFYRTSKVAPEPGKTITVDLRAADPKNPDHIEIRYVPTPNDVVARMCKLANVTKDDVVFDLGCGDGRIVMAAVEHFKAKRGVGVDLDPERIKESKDGAKERKLTDRLAFRVEDVLKLKDLSDADVVMLYMGDDVNLRLRPILQKTLKPGARIVSHRFTMGDWDPERTETFTGEDGDDYTLLLWTIGKKE